VGVQDQAHADGEVDRYKVRLVAKGYKQKYDIDYEKVFAPVAHLDTVRLLISLAAHHRWKYHLDIKSTFLNGVFEEVVYVQQPEDFLVEGQENKVYRLKKSLYYLKQAPRARKAWIDEYLHQNDYTKYP